MAPPASCKPSNSFKLFAGLLSACVAFVVVVTWRSSDIRRVFLNTDDNQLLIDGSVTERFHAAGFERSPGFERNPVSLDSVDAKSWTGLFIDKRHVRYIQNLNITPHDKWIIVDVTSGSCDRRLSVPRGWRVVLTSDAVAEAKGCDSPSCISLSSAAFGADRRASTDAEDEARQRVTLRNLAFLAVISGGARVILEAGCSVSLAAAVVQLWRPPGRDFGLMYSETRLFNPYAHFGAWAAVPRAFGKTTASNSKTYFVREFDNVLVRHGLKADSAADVTYAGRSRSGRTFDSSSPPVFVGRKSYSPVAPACSLYRQNAFWSLLLPCWSTGPRCRLLRQAIQQRLFRELDAFSGFYQLPADSSPDVRVPLPPSLDILLARTPPSAEKNSDERAAKNGSSFAAMKLIQALDAWNCDPELTFFGCLENIGGHLLKEGLIDEFESTVIKAWVEAVRAVTAVEPARVKQPWRGVKKTSETRVVLGDVRARLSSGGSGAESYLQEKFIKPVQTACGKPANGTWLRASQWTRPLIADIVLIVLFNSNKYFFGNLPALETMHRPFFRHIVYCVPNVKELLAKRALDLSHVTLVEAYSDSWCLLYECMVSVAQMNIQGVRGYLHIGDDTLLNSWTVMDMNANWMWWRSNKGQIPWLRTFAQLEKISGLSATELLAPAKVHLALSKRLTPKQVRILDNQLSADKPSPGPAETFSDLYRRILDQLSSALHPKLDGSEDWADVSPDVAKKFVKRYYHDHNMAGLVQHAAFDIFYVPQSMIRDYVAISRHFLRNDVMNELAMPAIVYGLAGRDGLELVYGGELWGPARHSPQSYYNVTSLFLHPFKLGQIFKKPETKSVFCDVHMTRLFSTLAKKGNV